MEKWTYYDDIEEVLVKGGIYNLGMFSFEEHIVHYFVSKDESRSLLSYDVKNMNCSINIFICDDMISL